MMTNQQINHRSECFFSAFLFEYNIKIETLKQSFSCQRHLIKVTFVFTVERFESF